MEIKRILLPGIAALLLAGFFVWGADQKTDAPCPPCGPAAADPDPGFTGTWVNDLKSEMQITVGTNGTISGNYKTAVGVPNPDDWYPLTGFANGDGIAFCVNWGNPNPKGGAKRVASLSCFVGEHTVRDGKEQIRTMWILDRNYANDEEDKNLWSSTLTGSNTFYRK